MVLSNKELQSNIYLLLLPFKKTFQGFITSQLYSFKYNNLDINSFLEPQISWFYREFVTELSNEIGLRQDDPESLQKFWSHFRFYLKGGKALNKLLNKIGNEGLNNLVYSTEELLQDKLCFFDQECITGSNTDYDFTMLIKEEEFYPNIDEDERVSVLIISLLKSIEAKLNINYSFNEWVEAFIKTLNTRSSLTTIYYSLKGTISDIKKFITEEEKKREITEEMLNYLKLKILQIDNLMKYLKNTIRESKNFFTSGIVKTTFSLEPISVGFIDEISTFFLYRLKLMINTTYPYKKLNRDIKDYLQGNLKDDSLPFDNIFGELIDISVVVGNDKITEEMWKSTEVEYMLQPIQLIYNDSNKPSVYDIQTQNIGKLFTYPVASLKYQLKDVIQVFNVDNPSKLKKRCQRFIEYLKLLCYSEELPDEFHIQISDELKFELEAEQKVKNEEKNCGEMMEILKILSKNNIGEENVNKFIVNKEDLQSLFSKNFCSNTISGDFSGKGEIIENLLNYIQSQGLSPSLSREQLEKINFPSLMRLWNEKENISKFNELIEVIHSIDLVNRIIPVELSMV